MANDPTILIADEPAGNLDSKTAETIFSLLGDLCQQGETVLVVTHESSIARRAFRTILITDREIANSCVAKSMPKVHPGRLLAATHKRRARQYEQGADTV